MQHNIMLRNKLLSDIYFRHLNIRKREGTYAPATSLAQTGGHKICDPTGQKCGGGEVAEDLAVKSLVGLALLSEQRNEPRAPSTRLTT